MNKQQPQLVDQTQSGVDKGSLDTSLNKVAMSIGEYYNHTEKKAKVPLYFKGNPVNSPGVFYFEHMSQFLANISFEIDTNGQQFQNLSRPYLAFGRRNPDPKLFYWIMLVSVST
jgi:hypothetical protein